MDLLCQHLPGLLPLIFQSAIALFLLLTTLLLVRSARRKGRQWNLPPGPASLPIIGNLHQISRLPHRTLQLLSKEHGPVMTMNMGSRVLAIVVTSKNLAGEIMRWQDLSFASRPDFVAGKLLSYGGMDVAFAPYGHDWRTSRKLSILKFFSLKTVQSYRTVREEEILDVLNVIRSAGAAGGANGGAVNLTELVLCLMTNILCRATMGERYPVGEYSKSRLRGIVKEMEAMLAGIFLSNYIPLLGWVDTITGMNARVKKNFRDMDSFFEEVIQRHEEKMGKVDDGASDNNSSVGDLINGFLQMHKDDTEVIPPSRERIKAILMNTLIAGTDTTGYTIIWAMSELVRNPEALTKAQQEVRHIVDGKGRVDEDDVEKLEYLELVVKETLRLHPPIPLMLPRECRRHCKLDGYDIPQGAMVFVNAWAIMRDPKHWVDPHEFVPERFLNKDADYSGQGFEFLPFGSGRRTCPGIHFAKATVNLTLANLLYCFNWDPMHGEAIDMTEVLGTTLRKKTDLVLVARPHLA